MSASLVFLDLLLEKESTAIENKDSKSPSPLKRNPISQSSNRFNVTKVQKGDALLHRFWK